MLGEPAGGYGCGEHHCGQPGAEADDDSPEQEQLPEFAHEERADEAAADQDHGEDDNLADAEIVHESGRERSHKPEQNQPDGERGRYLRSFPTELVLERLDEDAGGAHRASGHQHGQEGCCNDHPSIVDVASRQR